ncbi:MAG: WYL domain-containing protein, partial [Acetatifactor sp.]|nr:WYL domain-containing protein [Acetatifactor sp.]
IEIKALIKPEYKWKLVEEYGPNCYVEQEDGRLLFRSNYANKDYLIEWLLAFRDGVELVEPEEIREEMRMLLESIRKVYE